MFTVLATMSAWASTFGLLLVFVVIFPAFIFGCLGYAIGQMAAERRENDRYLDGIDAD